MSHCLQVVSDASGGPDRALPDQTASSAPGEDRKSLREAVLNPRAIAIIGASEYSNKIGGRPLLYLSRFGYRGRVYPINPHRATVQGRSAFPDIAAVPEAPDLAIIATPGAQAEEAVRDCAARGVRAGVVMSSGFGETDDPVAIARERRMVESARAAGMRLVGPNSQGVANFGTGTVASFSTMFLEVAPADGPVAIISQSGAMSVVPYGLLRSKGIGVRHSHATGNDADVTLSELALAVVEDPAVRLLLLYIESIRDPATLARVAAVARARDMPVVAVKAGRTPAGQKAARVHTGAIVNDDRAVDAFFRAHGIWRAGDVHEWVHAAELYLKGWRPTGRGLTVVSNSGAGCVLAADVVQEAGLELATLGEATVAAVAAQLPAFATPTNPIDLTAALLTNSALLSGVLPVLAADDAVDLLLISMPVAGAGYDVPAFARATADFADRTGKPVVVAAPQESVAAEFRRMGVPAFASETRAIAALAHLAHHVTLMRRTRVEFPTAPGPAVAELEAALRSRGPSEDGIIVSSTATSGRELRIAARVDPTFGLVLTLGHGGPHADTNGTQVWLMSPVDASLVREALGTFHLVPLFDAARGAPALDVESVCASTLALQAFMTANMGQLASIELSVVVGPVGHGISIADAIVEPIAHGRNGGAA